MSIQDTYESAMEDSRAIQMARIQSQVCETVAQAAVAAAICAEALIEAARCTDAEFDAAFREARAAYRADPRNAEFVANRVA